jgi:hypothetical protein
MSHTTDWRCRSCRAVLGRVRDGVLWPMVPVESVDGRGAARVPCTTCGRVRVWAPAGETVEARPRTGRPDGDEGDEAGKGAASSDPPASRSGHQVGAAGRAERLEWGSRSPASAITAPATVALAVQRVASTQHRPQQHGEDESYGECPPSNDAYWGQFRFDANPVTSLLAPRLPGPWSLSSSLVPQMHRFLGAMRR